MRELNPYIDIIKKISADISSQIPCYFQLKLEKKTRFKNKMETKQINLPFFMFPKFYNYKTKNL